MTSLTLWGITTPRTFRPIWMAEELGLSYDLKPIGPRTGETQTPEFTDLNRKQKVPFMSHGDVRLSESLAISRYLLDVYPSESVAQPDTVLERAKEDEWCCYVYGELDETALYVIRRHGDLKEIYGEAPLAVKSARAYIQRHLGVIAKTFASGRTSVLDCGFGLADIMLMSCLDWALFYGEALPDELLAYCRHIAQRPAYQRAMKINYPNLDLSGIHDGTT